MKHVTVLALAGALSLFGCDQKGSELLGNECTPESIPESAPATGYVLTSAAACGEDPCIAQRVAPAADAGAACNNKDQSGDCTQDSAFAETPFCSCRCDGPHPECLCPNGYVCRQFVSPGEQEGPSYCVHPSPQR